jgi:hypothetical protein
MRADRAAVNQFLIDFGAVNDLQAEHADDIGRMLKHLPTALGNVNKSFEPATGLVRFGLVQDNANPGCSYGTARRSPEDRSNRQPPKKLRCGGGGQSAAADTSGGATNLDGSAAFIPGVDMLGSSTAPGLPARMADWSWTLFYLYGV